MTKEKHMVEVDLSDMNEDVLNQYNELHEKFGLRIEAFLESYVDALQYEWEPYITENESVNQLYLKRVFWINEILKLDDEIDEIINSLED